MITVSYALLKLLAGAVAAHCERPGSPSSDGCTWGMGEKPYGSTLRSGWRVRVFVRRARARMRWRERERDCVRVCARACQPISLDWALLGNQDFEQLAQRSRDVEPSSNSVPNGSAPISASVGIDA